MYYLNARYYEAGIGRFLTQDAFKGSVNRIKSINRYAYTQGDPANLIDINGFDVGAPGMDLGTFTVFRDYTGRYESNLEYKNKEPNIDPNYDPGTNVTVQQLIIGFSIPAAFLGTIPGVIFGGFGIIYEFNDPQSNNTKKILSVLGAVPMVRGITVGGAALGGSLAQIAKVGRITDIVNDAVKATQKLEIVDTGIGVSMQLLGLGM